MSRRANEIENLVLSSSQMNEEMIKEAKKKRKQVDGKKKRDEKKEEMKKQRDALELKFYLEGYKPIVNPIHLKREAKKIHVSEPNSRVFKRSFNWTPTNVFLEVANPSIWEHICVKTYEEMDRKHRFNEVSDKVFNKYYKKRPSVLELMKAFSLRQYFRSKATNKKIEKQFNDFPSNFTKMTRERFNAIMSSLSCDWEELCHLLKESWVKCITATDHFVVDEAIFAFQTKTDPTCPKRFIPRKPHKNGLLVYLATTKTSKGLPYSFDLVLDISNLEKLNPRSALLAFVERFPWEAIKPHVTVDAGFSGSDVINIMNDKRFFFLSSVNVQHKKWLHDLLASNCPKNSWIGVMDKNNLMWSLKRSNKKNFFLVTNTYFPSEYHSSDEPDPIFTTKDISVLSKLSTRALYAIARKVGLTLSDPNVKPEEAIATFFNTTQIDQLDIEERSKDEEQSSESREGSSEESEDTSISEEQNDDSEEEGLVS